MLFAQIPLDPTALTADPRWTLLGMVLVWVGHQAGKLIDWYIATHGGAAVAEPATTDTPDVQ